MQLKEIQDSIGAWQDKTFGGSRAKPIVKHLREEVYELEMAAFGAEYKRSPDVEEEMADVFILLAALAHSLGVDLESAADVKMAKNRGRQWLPPDQDGVVRHRK